MLIIISYSSLLLALEFFPFLSSANHRWRIREAPNVNALPPQREVVFPMTPKLHRRCPSEILSRRPYSSVFEQGNTSGKTPMINPSSFIVDTYCDAELARKLFGDLNRNILGPPGDGKIIILDDSDDDAEAQEEKIAGIESTTALASVDSALRAPTSANDAPAGAKINNSDDQGLDQESDGDDGGRRSTGEP
jgi:hypothetical protein